MSFGKYDERYEKQIVDLALNRINTGVYKIFDARARIVTRKTFPSLQAIGKTGNENCLVIVNAEGETIVITEEFETLLRNALQIKK